MALSSHESSPAEYPPDPEVILEDGYPLQPQHIPLPGTDSAPLADVLALNVEINTSTISALQGLAVIRAADAEATTARWHYTAARATLRAAQANLEVFHSHRRYAWENFVTLLGDNAWQKGKGKQSASELGNISDGEPDDTGDARVVEDMLE